ncbi:MAG: hypothetical protein SynsKO_18340 [Synoicihabitans sp.]
MQAKRSRRFVFLGACVLGGAVFGYFGAKLIDGIFLKPEGTGEVLLTLLLLPLIWLLVVGWHELGHVVGGWMTGGRFLLLAVGPFMVRRTPSGLKMARNRSVNVGGGLAVCFPLDPALVSPGRCAIMILGGPAASIVLAGLLFGMIGAGAGGEIAWFHNLLVLGAMLTSMVCLLTIAPFVTGGFKSDGKRAWDLLKPGPHSDQEAALMSLTSVGLSGVRPADYEPNLMRRVTALNDGSLFALYGNITAFYYHADRGEWKEAQLQLDRVLEGEEMLVPYLRDVARCEYAWLLATVAEDADTARAWLETAGKLDFDPATRLRAEAAVAMANEDPDSALQKIADARHALENRSLSPVKNPFAVHALERLEERLEARSAGA